jgi:hypothetical protein
MINFVVEKDKSNGLLEKVRKVVVTTTTVALVLYLVFVSGLVGWGMYWSGREAKASATYDQVTAEVTGLAQQEIVVRKLFDRLKVVNMFLDSRPDLTTLLYFTGSDKIKVTEWKYNPNGIINLAVNGTNVDDIKTYSDTLALKFSGVRLDAVIWSPELNWTGNISMKGLKK